MMSYMVSSAAPAARSSCTHAHTPPAARGPGRAAATHHRNPTSDSLALDVTDDQKPSDAHLVLVDDCYQAVAAIAEEGARSHHWQVERLPATDPRWVQRASEADMLWLESPSNPLLEVADLAAICAAPRRAGTRV